MTDNINGISINYETAGEGPDILLLHGWGCSIDLMRPVMDRLCSEYRVWAIDFPGFGKSGEPDGPWSVNEYADITERFIDMHGIAPCGIIAHSFGARVAIMLSSSHPEKVSKMLLTGAAGLIPKRSAKYYIKVYSYKAAKAVLKFFGIKKTPFSKNAGSADYRALNDNMKRIFVNVVNQDLRPRLPLIKAPVLLFWGEDDTETPMYFAKIMESEIPDAGLASYPGAGHFAYMERLDDFAAAARYFFKGDNNR